MGRLQREGREEKKMGIEAGRGDIEGREYDTKKNKEWEKRKSKSGCPNELRVKFILSSERRN